MSEMQTDPGVSSLILEIVKLRAWVAHAEHMIAQRDEELARLRYCLAELLVGGSDGS